MAVRSHPQCRTATINLDIALRRHEIAGHRELIGQERGETKRRRVPQARLLLPESHSGSVGGQVNWSISPIRRHSRPADRHVFSLAPPTGHYHPLRTWWPVRIDLFRPHGDDEPEGFGRGEAK